jgi:hypothetical protein
VVRAHHRHALNRRLWDREVPTRRRRRQREISWDLQRLLQAVLPPSRQFCRFLR